jgi:lipopolysaccharide export system permease protein
VVLGYAISLYLMPAGFRTFKDEQVVLRSDLSQVLLQEGTFNNLIEGMTIYVRAREANGELQGILVHDSRDPELAITMMAETGALVNGPNGPVFIMANGNRQEVSRADRALRMLYFDQYTLDLSPLTEEPAERYREPKERFLHELLAPPMNASDAEHQGELMGEVHRRLVVPLNAVPLALIAVAAMLAGEFNRRRQWPRVAAGTVAGLAYVGLSYSLGGLQADSPELVPFYYALPLVASAAAALVMTLQRWPRLQRPRANAPTTA